MPAGNAIAVVVVTYQAGQRLKQLIEAVVDQLDDGDEFLIVDNNSSDDTVQVARSVSPRVTVIEICDNLGFASGCHVGAQASVAPLLFFLNPDAVPQADCLRELRLAASRHPLWSAWQAAVLFDEHRINTDGGVVHYLGIGWAGNCGEPASRLPKSDREVTFPSGAAMVVRRASWDALGGFDTDYFMYGEDLDLGLRIWLSGSQVGLATSAHVTHGYEFDKGAQKWFLLERNRWRTVLSAYPAALLVLIAPALLAGELGLVLIATRQRWLGAKLRAQAAVLRGLRRTLVRRHSLQASRQTSAKAFATRLTASLESPYLAYGTSSRLAAMQRGYWRVVCLLLGISPS